MAKKFSALRKKMTPASQARAAAKTAAMLAGDTVRSWLANLQKENKGIPVLIIVGGKALDGDGYFKNLAYAVEANAAPPTEARAREPREEPSR